MVSGMPNSPKGREIKHVDGSPGEIYSRGEEIRILGDKMHSAAHTLKNLKDNTFSSGELAGKAIESLKDVIGDSGDKLDQAAQLYGPVGPVIKMYGEMLETHKPIIDGSTDTCENLWEKFDSLPGDKDGPTTPEAGGGIGDSGIGPGSYDADSPQAKQHSEDNQAKQAAYQAWEDEAERFDTWYDVWEDGYDTAVSGISDGLSGKIKDSFWDDIGPVVDVLKTIVDIAGIIVAIVGLVAGGWIIALAASLLALAALALTYAQYKRGAASGTDLIWAAVGIVPFGKLSTLAKFGGLAKLARASGDAGALSKVGKAFVAEGGKTLGELKYLSKGARNACEDGAFKFKSWKEIKRFGFVTKGDIMKGVNGDAKSVLGRQFRRGEYDAFKGYMRTSQAFSGIGNGMSHYARFQTMTDGKHIIPGIPGLPSIPKVPGLGMPIDAVLG